MHSLCLIAKLGTIYIQITPLFIASLNKYWCYGVQAEKQNILKTKSKATEFY